MKKKILISGTFIILIALLIGIVYKVDMYMMDNNKPVIFSTWGYDYAPPEILGGVVSIIDKTKENDDFSYSTALEKIFEDEKNEYFLGCIKSSYIIVKYENGYEEDVKEALKSGRIAINDLDRFDISYITQVKKQQYENSFVATVIESTSTYIMVRPNENENEIKSSDKIVISLKKGNNDVYKVGSTVIVCYNGGIMESYPARIDTGYVVTLN